MQDTNAVYDHRLPPDGVPGDILLRKMRGEGRLDIPDVDWPFIRLAWPLQDDGSEQHIVARSASAWEVRRWCNPHLRDAFHVDDFADDPPAVFIRGDEDLALARLTFE